MLIQKLFGELAKNWKLFLSIHTAVLVLVVALLTPMASLLLNLVVLLSGDAALSDQDIVFFLLRPAGFAAFVILASLLSIIVFLEFAALVVAVWLSSKGRAVTVSGVLRYLAGRTSRLFGLAVWILLRVLMYSLPFLALIGAIYAVLLTDYDINFYLFNKPAEWYTALVLAGVVVLGWGALLVRLFSGWIFSLPLILVSPLAPGEAIAASQAAARGRRGSIVRHILGWLAFSLALSLLASLLAALLSVLLLPQHVESVKMLVLSLAFLSLFGAVESFFVSLVSNSALSLVILRLFEDSGLKDREEPASLAAAARSMDFRISRTAFVLGFAGLVLAGLAAVYGLVSQLKFENSTEVMAHRGASAAAPENTMAAVLGAIESGAQWVEIDVQETRDGEIVVIHDSDLKKVGGVPLVIARSTLEDLRQVDIGSWFEPRFSDQRIATLREVLEVCKGRIGVNIELKYYGSEQALEKRVAEIVESLGMSDEVVAMSLSLPGVREMKRLRPDWKVGLLSSVAVGNLAQLDVDFLALNASFASRNLVRNLHRQGKEVMVWTVNDALGISAAASRGVDAIITDKPELAISVLEQRSKLEPAERFVLTLADIFDRPSLVREQ
jgi:glycerophosphoryl diester phosphodiesterase